MVRLWYVYGRVSFTLKLRRLRKVIILNSYLKDENG